MDLGKMLAEALAIDHPDGFYPRENGEYVIDAWIDLDAAAVAFLAAVRAAERVEMAEIAPPTAPHADAG